MTTNSLGKMLLTIAAVGCCMGAIRVVPAWGADWPGLRGPTHDGVVTGERLAESWPAEGPAILWSRDLGQGYSGFAIVGDRAYTQYQNALGQYVICLERDTGDTIWEQRCGAPYELVGIYPGPRSTPAVFEGAVYYTTPDGEVGCLDASSGKQRWVKALQADLRGDGTEFGYAASPIVVDRQLFLPIGGPGASVVALSLPSGDVAWKSGDQLASYCSEMPITLAGQPLLVSYLQNNLVIQDRVTGRQLWQTELSVGYDEHSAMPVYREPILVVSAPFQAGSTAYELAWKSEPATTSETPALTVKQKWQQPKFSHDVDSAVIVGERIFGFDLRDPQSKAHRPSRGEFRAVNVDDGQILWSSKVPGQCNIVAAGDRLLLLNDAGELLLISASRSQYTELGRIKLFEDEICWTPPALSAGVALLRSHSRAIAVRVGPQLPPGASTAISPRQSRRWMPHLAGLSQLLLQGEREHPFMRPEWDELWRWYGACLAVGVLPLLVFLGLPRTDPVTNTMRAYATLLAMANLGVVVTPVLNSWSREQFAFTWPLTLFASFQTAILATQEVSVFPTDRAVRRRSVVAVAGMLVICVAYFMLLRQASLPHEWGFLMSFIPATPFAIWSARMVTRGGSRMAIAGMILIGFSAGFWGAVLAPAMWK